ncbi:MAG: NAD(+)/NADH kinase [bacterium]|nr:NAD(+)/NADH kinase [bacterium]
MTVTDRTMDEIRQVAVVAKVDSAEGAEIAAQLGAWFEQRDIGVRYEARTATVLRRRDGFPVGKLPADVDLAVVAGGDGSLLAVARAAAPLGLPILGVNLGSLGFLTELQPDELLDGLESVLAGRYTIEERQALRVRHVLPGKSRQEYVLLNDAVITKSALARMIEIDVRIDGEEVATYTSDGLIVSTPTGSTAYSLSAGGPILDPRMRAFVIAPICPHKMSYRPLVVPAGVKITVTLRSAGEAVYTTLDGQIGFPLDSGGSLEIDEHPSSVRLVRVAPRGFFEVLRRKLRWGV